MIVTGQGPSPAAILLFEADRERGSALAGQLVADRFEVSLACTPEHARVLARARHPAVVLLCATGESGGALELLREIRREHSEACVWEAATPVIVLGMHAEADTVRAFEAGADDCVPVTASYLELRARLRALLRRARPGSPPDVVRVGSLTVDGAAHSVTLEGRMLALRPMEFALLVKLASDPRRVFAHTRLLSEVWHYPAGTPTRTVTTHASRLRRKLALASSQPWVIAVRGVGYRLI